MSITTNGKSKRVSPMVVERIVRESFTSEFDAAICCHHHWRPRVVGDSRDNTLRTDGSEECSRCGAWCRRDADGKIVQYSAPIRIDEAA